MSTTVVLYAVFVLCVLFAFLMLPIYCIINNLAVTTLTKPFNKSLDPFQLLGEISNFMVQ